MCSGAYIRPYTQLHLLTDGMYRKAVSLAASPHLTHPVAFIASFWLLPSFFNPGFLAAKPSTYISQE